MYSSRLPAPAIGDMAHQPSCFLFPQRDFGKMSVVKRSFNRQWPQFSNMATVQWHGHSSVAWPQLTELEIDGRKQFESEASASLSSKYESATRAHPDN